MEVAKNKVNMAGDVTIEDVSIITSRGFAQSITPQVVSIEIYEDMFAPFITGKILVRDAQDLINLFPLIGEELVRFKIITPSLPEKHAYEGEFYIYKMDDKTKTQNSEFIYVLHFISKEALVDINKKISKGYKGLVSDIARKILSDPDALETTKTINIEETVNSIRYTSNFWSPVRNLQYLADNAVSKEYESPSYLFFENKYGLHFVSLETMYANSPLAHKFVWDNYSAEIESGGGSRRNLEEDYRRVLDMQWKDVYNYMDRVKSGMFGSEIIYYDILTKQYVHNFFEFDHKKKKHLNEFPFYSKKLTYRPKALILNEHQYYNNFDEYDVVSNTKTVQERTAILAQAEALKMTITVFGRTDISAGQKIYLEVPRNKQLKPEDPDYLDLTVSGHYLIGAVCHYITREKHECTMEIIRESLMVDPNEGK